MAPVPVTDIGKVVRTPPPKYHRKKLPKVVRDTLDATEEALRNEIEKCLKILAQLVPTADEYGNVSVRLAGHLRDYMRVSGAEEVEHEAKEVRKAIVQVEAFVEKQLRQQAISGERERRREAEERHLRHVQVTDSEADSLEQLGGPSGGEGSIQQKKVDVSGKPTQKDHDDLRFDL